MTDDQEKQETKAQIGLVECFISKKRVPAAETIEVERNGRRVLVHKRFSTEPKNVQS